MHYSEKTKKSKFSHYVLEIVVVSINLLNESNKILKI